MNLHEYQAKELFANAGIIVPLGTAATSQAEIQSALDKIANAPYVIKSQIHAGGRGKGRFKDGFEGGVKIAQDADEAKTFAERMLGNTLVTKQTGPEGRVVRTLYITEAVKVDKEFYAAITLNRATGAPVLIVSSEGGMEIEEVAKKNPAAIVRVEADPLLGLKPYQARVAAAALGLKGDLAKQATNFFLKLYKLWWEKDLSLVEVNPLVTSKSGRLIALDAKICVEDNALLRHPELAVLRDLNEEDSKETEANQNGLSYVALDGNIACMVNGAGLAMSTMDIISYYGGKPANFLDVGGGADEKQVETAFRIILKDPKVKAILINIFGGIMKCDVIAAGVIAAAKHIDLKMPLVVRLEGTNFELGRKMLQESGLKIHAENSLTEAAKKVVELAK